MAVVAITIAGPTANLQGQTTIMPLRAAADMAPATWKVSGVPALGSAWV